MHHNSLPKGEQFISLDNENKTYVIIWNVCHTHGTRESYKLSAEGHNLKQSNLKDMKAVVINNCYGGYGTSDIVTREYLTRKGIPFTEEEGGKYMPNIFHITNEKGLPARFSGTWDIDRDDPLLVELVAQLGEGANGSHAELQINYYEDGMEYHISEYDGWETLTFYVPVTMYELLTGVAPEKVRLIEICGKVELVR